MNIPQQIAHVWHWLTTSRYTQALEAEVARLCTENQALVNSVLEHSGYRRMDEATEERKEVKARTRPSLHQWQARRTAEAARQMTPRQVRCGDSGGVHRTPETGAQGHGEQSRTVMVPTDTEVEVT